MSNSFPHVLWKLKLMFITPVQMLTPCQKTHFSAVLASQPLTRDALSLLCYINTVRALEALFLQ